MHATRRAHAARRPLEPMRFLLGAALALTTLAALPVRAQDAFTTPAPGLDGPRGDAPAANPLRTAPRGEADVPEGAPSSGTEAAADGRTNVPATAIIRQLAPIRGGNPNAPVVVDVPTGPIGFDPARAVDLTVFFAFDSDRLLPEAVPQLDALAAALRSPELESHGFLIGGHTDAKGTAAYNQSLSERRALAVVEHLVRRGGVSPTRLVAYGWGEERLKLPSDPLSGANRRVEVALIVPREDAAYDGYATGGYATDGYATELSDPRLGLASDALDDFNATPTP